jgi:hypothetical protein
MDLTTPFLADERARELRRDAERIRAGRSRGRPGRVRGLWRRRG